MMHGHEKSDSVIVAVKPANEAEQPAAERSAAEPRGSRQYLDPLVIPDRLDVHAAEPRKLTDRQIFGSRSCDCRHGKVLDPVVTTGCILRPMTINQERRTADVRRREWLMAAGGLLGALAASSCCILP